MAGFSVGHLPLPGGAPAPKNPGSLPPPAPLPCATPPRHAGGGHARRSLASVGHKGRGKSVLSRVRYGVSEKRSTTTARTPPSLREALWRSKKWAIQVGYPPSVNGPPSRRHRRDPETRKSSIVPGALGGPVSCPNSSPREPGTGPCVSISEWLKTDHRWEVIEAACARSDLFE